jgi:hypothetical protein
VQQTDSIVVEPALSHTLTLRKRVGKFISTDMSDTQIRGAISGVMNVNRVKLGWNLRFADESPTMVLDDTHFGRVSNGTMGRMVASNYSIDGDNKTGYTYRVDVVAECKPVRPRNTLGQEFDNIAAGFHQRLISPRLAWELEKVDGETYRYLGEGNAKDEVDPNEEIGYAPFELPAWEDFIPFFSHLYGLDDYARTIYDTLKAAVDSGWRQRINIALIGPPACGKSEMCKATQRALGGNVVLEMDGTSTTAAAAQLKIKEALELWRVIVLEELEKQEDSATNWLLSVLDIRGEVKKAAIRNNIDREVHMVGICTVNDEDHFKKMNAGALASRFSLPLVFERPSDNTLHKILARECNVIDPFDTGHGNKDRCAICERPMGGGHRWIVPTLKLAREMNTTDPRRVVAFALTGRDALLNGSYQARIKRIMRPDERFNNVPQRKDNARALRPPVARVRKNNVSS